MPGLHIPEAPGFSGWTRLRDGSWKTMKPADIADVRLALATDTVTCASCIAGGPVKHGTTYIVEGREGRGVSAHSYRCRSGSRWYNPQTRQMEGRAHCTCDYCF